MILGIGTDLTEIKRIDGVLKKQGKRFLNRCFDEKERLKVENTAKNPQARAAGYAKRWAAKEACAKALGLGIRNDIFLKDIVVVNDKAGKPSVILKGGAKKRLAAITPKGMAAAIHISLSDEATVAAAFVVIAAEKKG